MNVQGVINAVKDLYRALDSVPPDEFLAQLMVTMKDDRTAAQWRQAQADMQKQYVDIGIQLKQTLDKAASNNQAAPDAKP